MALTPITERLRKAAFMRKTTAWVADGESGSRRLYVRRAVGSVPAFLAVEAVRATDAPVLCLAAGEDAAAYLHSDVGQIWEEAGASDLLHFPAESRTFYDPEQIADASHVIQRADVLQRLKDPFGGVVVTDLRALCDRVAAPEAVVEDVFAVRIGEEIPPESLVERLVGLGFVQEEFAGEPGELAQRGGIVDVYPFTGDYPVRIEFFGDEIDSIREFDPATQRSVSRLDQARIVPNFDRPGHRAERAATLLSYLPAETVVVLLGGDELVAGADGVVEEAAAAYAHYLAHRAEAERSVFEEETDHTFVPPEDRFLSASELGAALDPFRQLHIASAFSAPADLPVVDADARPQPPFNSSIKRLRARLDALRAEDADVYLLCDSNGQRSRLYDLLDMEEQAYDLTLTVESLHEGFEAPEVGLVVYTDHQIFNRYHRPTVRKRRPKGGISLRELRDLQPGDFVVHIDFGIGRFGGMEKIEVRGKQQEAVRVQYEGNDVLYVNVNALHKLHKYTGKEGHQPRLTRLGSGQWERIKARTKKKVKAIARDLIKLYAERKASPGYAFPEDTLWQRELEASFEYEDTPDQAAAAAAVKTDMEQPAPMDRLVCGDVGFGKTEVAVRAAFKAVQDGTQVAVLVPTTILADQHYETFSRRLKAYPVEVDVLSRFRSAAEQKETLKRVKAGQVDVLIGTHRIVSKDVEFKNLGLLIVDEEQRFGVKVKERLRKMRPNVDTLTLTATPIPRTLQFSLLGARDLSIINTPPPNRQPIVTEIHTFDRDLIRDAILYEVNRGGQVYFIHNRVKSIEEMAQMLRELVPNVRFRVGHGQMRSAQLERVMHDFIAHKFDVLVSTNIVESGLDVPNANTMVINHAERFGLADLHQLRGRVGRSDRKAFCYLLTPSVRGLTKEARQRLQAVEEFSDLGSGFNIAMRDLDIRGAGSLLGTQQSGFIADVGFETFHRILDEAVQELRTEEFGDLFDTDEAVPPAGDTTVDVDADALIPDRYVASRHERLSFYRRLSEATRTEDLDALRAELVDRFGPLPAAADHLLLAAELKLFGQALRLPRVRYKNERLFLEFPKNEDQYFYEHLFHPLLARLDALDHRFVLKDDRRKLRAIIQAVPDLPTARRLLERLAAPEMLADVAE